METLIRRRGLWRLVWVVYCLPVSPPSILYWTSDYHKFFNCLNPLKLMRNKSLKIREHSRNFVVLHVSGRID